MYSIRIGLLLIAILFNSTILPMSVDDELKNLVKEAVEVNPRIKMLQSKAQSSASRINSCSITLFADKNSIN